MSEEAEALEQVGRGDVPCDLWPGIARHVVVYYEQQDDGSFVVRRIERLSDDAFKYKLDAGY